MRAAVLAHRPPPYTPSTRGHTGLVRRGSDFDPVSLLVVYCYSGVRMGSVKLSTKLVGSAGITKGIQWDPQHVESEPFGSAETMNPRGAHGATPICRPNITSW